MRLTDALELKHIWTIRNTDHDDWWIEKDGEFLGVATRFADLEQVILAHETGDVALLERIGWGRS